MNETGPVILMTMDYVLAALLALGGVEFLLVAIRDCSIRPLSRALLGVLTVCAFAATGLLLLLAPLDTDWNLLQFSLRLISAVTLLLSIIRLRKRWMPE